MIIETECDIYPEALFLTDLYMVYSCSSVHVILHSGANSVRN